MGKAKPVTTTPPTPAATPEPAEPIGLSEAIREGFKAVPESVNSGNRDATSKLKDWIAANYRHLAEAVDTPTFGSTLSGQRKRAGGSSEAPARAKSSSSEPTLTDLMEARKLVTELEMTPGQLHELVVKLTDFGDIGNLKKCLNALVQLAGE